MHRACVTHQTPLLPCGLIIATAACSRDQEEIPEEDHPADADADADAPPSGDIPPPHHEEHNEEPDNELFSCPFCPEALPDAESLQEHFAKEHYCPACDRCDVTSMSQHMEEHHKPDEAGGSGAPSGGFVCCEEGCEETFETEQEMLEHYGSCPLAHPSSSQKPDEAARDHCPLCNKVISSQIIPSSMQLPSHPLMKQTNEHDDADTANEAPLPLPPSGLLQEDDNKGPNKARGVLHWGRGAPCAVCKDDERYGCASCTPGTSYLLRRARFCLLCPRLLLLPVLPFQRDAEAQSSLFKALNAHSTEDPKEEGSRCNRVMSCHIPPPFIHPGM